MRLLILSATLLLRLAACSPLQTVTPIPPILAPTLTAPTNLPTPSVAATGTQPPPGATAGPQAGMGGPIVLQVLSPLDGAVVNTQQVTVTGATAPGAVVTVNDDIIVVGTDGQFHSTVTLDEGLNLIEIIASNTSGSEATVELTVTYEP
jgi:glucodextranase-like protein